MKYLASLQIQKWCFCYLILLLLSFSCNFASKSTNNMSNKTISSLEAPKPIGPYSQAVWAGNTLYLSGQIAIDPANSELNMETLENETHQVMKNLEAILTDQNLTFDHVVKSGIFLADMNNFSVVNEIYGSYMGDQPPARETVEVACLPKNVNVEISVIAYRD